MKKITLLSTTSFLALIITTFVACNKSNVNKLQRNEDLMSTPVYSTQLSEIPDKGNLGLNDINFIDSFITTDLFNKYNASTQINIQNTRINYDKSFVGEAISANNIKVFIYNIAVVRDNVLIGYAIFYKKPDSYINANPDNDPYVLGFRDYVNYSIDLKSGIIKDIDINFNYHIGTLVVDDNIIDWENSVIMSIPGDANNDGNLSYSECYHYMSTACESDPECKSMLDMMNLVASLGTLAIMAACSILAAMY